MNESTADLIARTRKLERAIRRRDAIEATAAAIVVGCFGWALWSIELPSIPAIGVGIIMVAALASVVVMSLARHWDAAPDQSAPLKQFCQAEITRLDRQIQLLRTVSWWYSGPILTGCCVFFVGILLSVPELPAMVFWFFLVAFLACFAAASVIIQGINARGIRESLAPLRGELAEVVRLHGDNYPNQNSDQNDSPQS